MILFIILISVTIFLIRAWYRNHYQYWVKRGFVSDVPNFPFDSITGAGTKMHNSEKFDEYYQRFKGQRVFGIFSVSTPGLAVYDPELIQSILVKDFTYFHDRFMYYNEKDDPLSAHLAAINGQKWKERRTKLSPIFTSGKMKMMFSAVNGIGDRFIRQMQKDLKQSNELEISEWLARYTTDVIGDVAFGINCNCLDSSESEFRKHGRTIFSVAKPLEAFKWLFVHSFQKFSRKVGIMLNEKNASKFFLRVFGETIKYRENNNIERNDFVNVMLQMKRRGIFSFNEIAAESFIFYVGGFHTSAALMNFILYELALNQDIQDKLRKEIIDKIDENDGKLTYDSLSQIKYLDMVINEGLRKYPPANVLTRKCTKDYKIPGMGLTIPKGTQIIMPIYSIHRDPEYYQNPEIFDPERFNDENVKNIRPFTFLPFGEGPRFCIGARFAMMTTKTAIVKLLTSFKFDSSPKTLIPMKYSPKNMFLFPFNEELFLFVKKI